MRRVPAGTCSPQIEEHGQLAQLGESMVPVVRCPNPQSRHSNVLLKRTLILGIVHELREPDVPGEDEEGEEVGYRFWRLDFGAGREDREDRYEDLRILSRLSFRRNRGRPDRRRATSRGISIHGTRAAARRLTTQGEALRGDHSPSSTSLRGRTSSGRSRASSWGLGWVPDRPSNSDGRLPTSTLLSPSMSDDGIPPYAQGLFRKWSRTASNKCFLQMIDS
jgi:hypothetical protein